MRPLIRRAAAGAVIGVVATALMLPAHGVDDDLARCQKRSPGAIVTQKNGWAKIRIPQHAPGDGPTSVVSFTTSPGLRNRMYSTNGSVIKATADAGCTWLTIWRGNQPQPPQVEQVDVDVFTHLVAPQNDSLWVAAYDDNAGVHKPRVYALDLGDGNSSEPTQTTIDNGLPPEGTPIALDVVPTPGSATAFLLLNGVADTKPVLRQNRLFVTYVPSTPPQAQQIGSIWKEVALPEGFGEVQGLLADSGGGVVVWSKDAYAVTDDAVADQVGWTTGDAGGEIVTASKFRSVVTFVVKQAQGVGGLMVDAATGKAVGSVGFPIAPTAITHGERSGVVAVSGPKGTWGYDVGLEKWLDITPAGAKAFQKMKIANALGGGRYLVGFDGSAFWRFDMFDWELFRAPPPLEFGDLNIGTVPRSNLKNLVLTPERKVVTVQPGVLHKEPIKMRVPPVPNRLDVFFIVDTTGSMQPSIDGLKQSILSIAGGLREVLKEKDEVCFGVGDVKDDSGTGGYATGGLDYLYKTRQKIVCEPPALPKIKLALNDLHANIGGDDPEAQTVALREAVTGLGSVRPFYVAPNQDAGFRQDALKVIVMITDDQMHSGGNYPTFDEAIGYLNSADVEFVGVQALRERIEETYAELREIATGTGTVAPPGGVDCDGDGKITLGTGGDLKPGDPLVCQTSGVQPNIGGAVLGLLLGVEDPGTIAVEVGDPDKVVQDPIEGETAALRNLKRESRLEFTLPLKCTKAQDGKDLPVYLQPNVRNRYYNPLGEITVRCRSLAPPPPEPPAPDPIPDPVVKPRPKPPQAIPIQPPPQPPAITNVNLNAGFSQQEEQQFQLAAVTQDAAQDEEMEEVELAMTGLDRPARDVLPASAAWLAGATALSAAAGVAYRRRLQRSPGIRYVKAR